MQWFLSHVRDKPPMRWEEPGDRWQPRIIAQKVFIFKLLCWVQRLHIFHQAVMSLRYHIISTSIFICILKFCLLCFLISIIWLFTEPSKFFVLFSIIIIIANDQAWKAVFWYLKQWWYRRLILINKSCKMFENISKQCLKRSFRLYFWNKFWG